MKVAIVGITGAIGHAFYEYYLNHDQVTEIFGFSRQEPLFELGRGSWATLDLNEELSIATATALLNKKEIDRLIIATGLLHNDHMQPEKSISQLDALAMIESYQINAVGPGLVLKHFLPFLKKTGQPCCALLSARVGSISDNHLGGWYSYRMAKAALNMLIKSASIEWKRKSPESILVGLHPGTVDSHLSKPFQANLGHALFTPSEAVSALDKVLNQLRPKDSGKCFAYDGLCVPA